MTHPNTEFGFVLGFELGKKVVSTSIGWWKKDLCADPATSAHEKQKDKRRQCSPPLAGRLAPHRRSSPKHDESALPRLPHELLLMVIEHLDDISVVCLKYTSSYFNYAVCHDIAKLSRCQRWLLSTR